MTVAQTIDHGWWLASRSAGIVAYLLLSASVVLGLTMALRTAPPAYRSGLRLLHERLALVALAAVGAHGLLLLGDGWLRPGLTGILVPFALDYRPLWTGLGILGGYLASALSLTYYARQRIGARRWRTAHRLIPLAWAMAAVHVIGAGSDARSLWLEVPLALMMAAILALLGHRIVEGRPAPRRDPVRRRAPAFAPATVRSPAPDPADAVTATAPPAPGYRPLWVRNPAPLDD